MKRKKNECQIQNELLHSAYQKHVTFVYRLTAYVISQDKCSEWNIRCVRITVECLNHQQQFVYRVLFFCI